MQKIQETQQQDLDSKDYEYRELIYIPKSITEEFVKDFHKGLIQGYNKIIILVNRL